MLAGVQLSDGLKLEAIADGGFSYAEIPYEIIFSTSPLLIGIPHL